MECARVKGNEIHYHWAEHKDGIIENYELYETALYVRGYVKNASEDVIRIREAFGGVEILTRDDAPENEIAFITPVAKEKELKETLSDISDFVAASVIRVL